MRRPTYTPASIIKKVFRPGERSLPKTEVCLRIEESGLFTAQSPEDSERLLNAVLNMEHSPVRIGRSEAIIELTHQSHQLFDLAYRFLRLSNMPKAMEQIVPELRRQTQFSWNQINRLLILQRDPRFVQFESDKRWYLADWKVANDTVAQFMQEHQISEISTRSLPYFLDQEVGLPAEAHLFLPELDERFRLDGDTLLFVLPEKTAQGGQEELVQETNDSTVELVQPNEQQVAVSSHAEVAATFQTMEHSSKEEITMNGNQMQTTYTEVHQLMRQALERLEARHQQMAQEVISFFQQSDMQSIEILMKEKHKNEQVALGIQQVLATIEQQ
ncbi:hypothetical protein [Brevibacillus fulvus]|uniref:Uncharacterized protein n=1 Tax=Brevibacillus fulvus TaxID=1125967 RepID=A0A939BSQ8_9BACL|nr:hypothetical protein [Brevibacillus fulvus]MBM7590987.1 hypothetical protein [Brevibacillus fulvus]